MPVPNAPPSVRRYEAGGGARQDGGDDMCRDEHVEATKESPPGEEARESTSPHGAIFHHRPPPVPLNRRAGGVDVGGDQWPASGAAGGQAGDHQSRPLTATHTGQAGGSQ